MYFILTKIFYASTGGETGGSFRTINVVSQVFSAKPTQQSLGLSRWSKMGHGGISVAACGICNPTGLDVWAESLQKWQSKKTDFQVIQAVTFVSHIWGSLNL